ncbi:hypothetical protein OS493_022041 [Desmophyllum pertusum]|uniref:Uncharacterized protein n=1 Tax=Desmophyllum pertusum TaxID=174260 RepID=A0A9W9YYG7_9CNID|nr:hypothetical protein OS493_022041 [Desmophyllum pertusum]
MGMTAESNSRKRALEPNRPEFMSRKKPGGQLPSYEQFAAKKSEERRGHFKPKVKVKQATPEATVNIGLMEYEGDILKPVRGSSLPLKVKTNASYGEILDAALKKREAFDRTFSVQRGYVLAYPDSRIAKQIPGTKDEDFVLQNYKDWLGKPYSRLSLYLSPIDKKESDDIGSPESEIFDWDWSDTEEIISSMSNGDCTGSTNNNPSVLSEALSETVDHSFLTTDFL